MSGAPGALARETRTTYVTSPNYTDAISGAHLRRLPASTTVYDGAGTIVAQSTVSYDEAAYPVLTYGSVTGWTDPLTSVRGNPTTVSHWLNTTNTWLQAHAQYDQCGSLRKTWDARDTSLSNPAQIEYSSTYAYAYPTLTRTAVPDPSGQNGSTTAMVVTSIFDFSTGLPTSTTDANGIVTNFEYNDALDRLTRTVHAVGTTAQTQMTVNYDDGNRLITTTSDQTTYNDNLLKSQIVYDGLGRMIESRQYEGGSNYIDVQTQYDAMGRAYKVSNPFRPWQGETPVWTTTAFDALGRIISVTTPDLAVVITSYSGNAVTVADQAGKQRKSVIDALGRLVQVYEDPSGLNYLTNYSYDTLDDLITVNQGSQTRSFVYDSLKRLTSATNLESGTINYQYDNNGNLLVKTEARGVSVHYDYDALNRVFRRWYNGSNLLTATTHNSPALPAGVGATDEIKYFYDSQSLPTGAPTFDRGYATGRLVAMTYGGGSAGNYLGYDPRGKPLRSIQQTGVINYQTSAIYNLAGAVTTLIYPSGRTVTNTYDSAGRTSSVAGYLGDGTLRTYSAGIVYSPFGGMTKEKLGTTSPIFNKLFYNSRGQLAEIRESTSYTGPTDITWNRGAIINSFSNNCTGVCSGQTMTDNNGNLKKQQHWIPDSNGNLTANFVQRMTTTLSIISCGSRTT